MKKTILITGGAGFVGSTIAIHLAKKNKKYKIIVYDNLIRPGSRLNLARLKDHHITFIKGDVRNYKTLSKIKNIKTIIDCAAEPSVLAAFHDPKYTIDTNLIGTIHCLELAKQENANFIFLSSNRVYPIDQLNHIPFTEKLSRFEFKKSSTAIPGLSQEGISEKFQTNGTRSLYGATKLCSEHIILEYNKMFGIKSVINRCGIIAGPWQMGKIDQGLIGFWIAQHHYKKPLKYIGYNGSGKQVRDAIHVQDIAELVELQIKKISKINGCLFNVGGGKKNSFSLKELTEYTQQLTNEKATIQSQKKERPDDIRIYFTDNSLITKTLGWNPQRNLKQIITDTHDWIKSNSNTLRKYLT